MSKLTGYKRVAVIHQGCVDYYYALYDEDIAIGDTVLVSGRAQGTAWKIKSILSVEDFDYVISKIFTITAEVICKIDMSKYDARVARRKQAEKIRSEMDKKIKEMQEADKYEMYASKNPELAELLEAYKELMC